MTPKRLVGVDFAAPDQETGPRRNLEESIVRNTSIILGTLIALAVAGVSHAQRPANITREMIATALPVEGAPLAVAGPYKVESGPAFGSPGHVVYRPADLTPFPGKDTLPLMVWGNGGCAINSTRYGGFLTTIASHGFVVMATAAEPGAEPGTRSTADNLRKAIDWADAENKRAGSPLNGKIALDKVAVMGQSCGGFLSIELGADPRVDTIGVFNSGAQGDNIARLTALHGPVLLINGHERDFLMASSKATYDAIDKLPAFYGARHGAGHTATVDHPGGGEWANVASNWLKWQFKSDKQAAKMFVGKDCALCTNSNWDTASKHLQ
jgi:dienelactone hydrolase